MAISSRELQEPKHSAQRWFVFACVLEGGLGLLAALIAVLAGLPWRPAVSWKSADAGLGLLAMLPLLAVFGWMLTSHWPPLRRIADSLERIAGPVFGQWTWWQLALVSLLAGGGEELLFRQVAQGGLSKLAGTATGLLLASLIFGAFHAITRAYFVIASLMGAYLGILWIFSGNLLVPIVAHASYDFVALLWFLSRLGLDRSPE